MLTLLLTSSRVPYGMLTWEAWSVLRAASRVLSGPPGHPAVAALAAALAEAGVAVEVTDVPASEPALAAFLAAACGAVAGGAAVAGTGGDDTAGGATAGAGTVVWLAPPGSGEPASLLRELADVPGLAVSVVRGPRDLPGSRLLDVVSVMDTLRTSCPWDREQTHASLLRYLLEETYEAAEAIESSDWASLREELGDVLLQAVFHARVAAERPAAQGGFTIDDVADELTAKLVRRHPHVFGPVAVSSAADVHRNWEEIKKAEKASRAAATGSGPPSVLDGVAFGQPALSLAAQLWRRAERAGLPAAPDPGPAAPEAARPEAAADDSAGGDSAGGDSAVAAAIGAELMRIVERAQRAGVDPELALRRAARRFAERVRELERAVGDGAASGADAVSG